MTERDRDSLKIGDFVNLRSVLRDGYLSAAGILADYIYIQTDLALFDECIFMVELQRQYSASSELERYLSTFVVNSDGVQDDSTEKYIKALERGRNNETMLNESYMKTKIGQPVVFGDIIQLRHVKSGKFLTVVSTQVATDERENLTVTLNVQGSPYSWLQIAPRYKIDRIGDTVQTNTEVYLKVAERKNEYVHAADRHITVQRPREVNCSLEPTSWKISIFTSSIDFSDSTLLLANDLVSIYDAETKSYLSILKRDAGCSTSNDDEDGQTIGSFGRRTRDRTVSDSSDYEVSTRVVENTSSPRDVSSPRALENDAVDEIEFLNGVCEVVIRPSEEALDSNALWVVESETLIKGGPVEWKTQQIRFKNLNTGLYLLVEEVEYVIDDESAASSEPGGFASRSAIVLNTTTDRADPRTLIYIQEIYSTRAEASCGKPVQFYSTKITDAASLWLARGESILVEDNNKVSSYFNTCFAFDKNEAISFLITRYDRTQSASDAGGAASDVVTGDAEGKEEIEPELPLDVHCGVSFRLFFENYLHHTEVPKVFHKVSTFWPKLLRADIVLFERVANKCVCFANGYHISKDSMEDEAANNQNAFLRTQRQNLLREQGVLEVLLQIIHKLTPISQKVDQLIRNSAPMDALPDAVKQLFAMSGNVLMFCLMIIFNCIQYNTETQLYVANFMPILLSHLNAHPLAGSCVTEMLNNNMELQETKIGNREIAIFVEKLKESKYNGMYLRLLQSCCSCQGNGVDGNQRKIVLKLLEDTKDCFMFLKADWRSAIFMEWSSHDDHGTNKFIPEVLMRNGDLNAIEEEEEGVCNDNSPLRIDTSSVRATSPGSPKKRRGGGGGTNLIALPKPREKQNPALNNLKLCPVKGEKLMRDGVPQLTISWVSSNVEYSPQGIFNKMDINLEELFTLNSGAMTPIGTTLSRVSMLSRNRFGAKDELREKISDYFIAELYLAAELCMDQNYVSMLKLDDLFPYDVLVAILRIRVNDSVKAAAVRLIHYLYVDRYPQSAIPVPRLSRSWADVMANPTPALPSVVDAHANTFVLLQHIVSEHVKGMQGVRWTPLSLHMMRVMNCMLNFNFYGTKDKLGDVIFPLIKTLDRRNVAEDEVSTIQKVVKTGTTGREKRKESILLMKQAKLNDAHASGPAPDASADNSGLMSPAGVHNVDISAISLNAPPGAPVKVVRWQKGLHDFMNSIPVMLFVLAVVLVAVAEVFWVVIANVNNHRGTGIWFFEIAVCVFFVTELSLKSYAYYVVKEGRMRPFLRDRYNQIDIGVIIVDVVFLSLPEGLLSGGGIVKVLRLARLARLLRLTRAVKVATAITKVVQVKKEQWKLANRFTKLPAHELEAMVEASSVLVNAQNRIDDRNISLFLLYFYNWERGVEKRSISSIFDQIMKEYSEVSLETNESDAILLDLLLFNNETLVQSILEVFMAIYSARRMFLVNARNIQLIVSAKREKQFKKIEQMVLDLDRTVETQELWGELETEEHRKDSALVWSVLNGLLDVLRVKRYVLEFDQFHKADVEVQDILRNVGFFNTIMKVINLLERVEEEEVPPGSTVDDESIGGSTMVTADGRTVFLNEGSLNCLNQVKAANTLLCWFLYRNSANQELGYEELEFFMDSLDRGVNSHMVIKCIFESNEKVCKQCPFETMELMANLICKEGQKHYYLTLLDSVTHAGERHILENQYQVVKVLTDPDVVKDVVCFFTSPDTEEYEEKVRLMEPYLKTKDVNIEDLPDKLKYHIVLLEALSSCTISNANMATIEAKAQALFPFYDIVRAMLDPRTLLLCKIKLGMFFFNSTVDCEMVVPGMENSAAMWELVKSFAIVFVLARDELRTIEKCGWEASNVSRQNIEYMLVCVRITCSFFKQYYNPLTFRVDEIAANAADALKLNMNKINEIIRSLFSKLFDLYEADSPRLSKTHKQWIYDALWACNRAASSIIVVNIDRIHDTKHALDQNDGLGDDDDDFVKTAAEIQVSSRYEEFVSLMENDSKVKSSIAEESLKFVDIIESLPRMDDETARADVRYEAILRKLVMHSRGCFRIVRGEKNLESSHQQTIRWLLGVFLTMIEKHWGMSLEEREARGGEEEDEKAAEVIFSLDYCGVTALCLDAIAVGVDIDLQIAALKLAIALLVKDGGSLAIQQSVYSYLVNTRSELFFKQIRKAIAELIEWHSFQNSKKYEKDEPLPSTDLILYIRFLQLLCIGHNLDCQHLLRVQSGVGSSPNTISICLLNEFVSYLSALSKYQCRISTRAAIKVAFLILNTVQGPCEENQTHYALETQLLEALNRLMRAKLIRDCVNDEEIELKMLTIGIFQGLLEGQGSKRSVYEKFLGVIHLDILQLLCEEPKPKKKEVMPIPVRQTVVVPVAVAADTDGTKVTPSDKAPEDHVEVDAEAEAEKAALAARRRMMLEDEEEEEEQEVDSADLETPLAKDFRIKAIVLLRSLMDYDSSVQEILNLTDADVQKLIGKNTASIEIVWRGELQRRFFRIPDICRHLAASSRNAFVEDADRSTVENKLLCFLDRVQVLYREISHQQRMTDLGVAKVFSKQNYDTSTWAAFFLAVLVNFLFLCYYRAPSDMDPFIATDSARTAIGALNVLQIVLASFNVAINIVVRCPVIYQGYIADGHSQLYAIYQTAQDPLTMYYFGYTVLAFVGFVWEQHVFLIFLLFDIVVKNSTVRDVLNSVVLPRYQLGMASLLGLFVIYIHSFFAFLYYNDEMLDVDECKDLWTCFKLGIKSVATDGGIGEVMSDNLGIRMLLTMSYFFAVMVVLLNIIFGITIDTFGALRQAKLIRMEDTENICYICGIENIVFDRIERNGFDHHIREDHYMWNYFYFITYIWEQNKDDDDGFEHYVRHCVEKGDITWFPINKALRLRATKTAKDILKSELKSELKKSEGGLIGHWAKIENAARDKFIVFRTIFNSLQEEKSHQATRTSSVMSNMRASAANLTSGAHTPVRGNSNLSLDTPKVRTISDVPDGETSVKPPQPPTDPTKGGASKFRPVSPGNYDISLCTVELIGNKTSKLVYNSLIALGVVASSNYHASVSDIEVVCHIRVPPHRGAGEKSFTSHCHLNVVDGVVMEPLVFPPSSFTLYKSINAPVELNVAATVVISIGVPKSTLDNVTSPVGGVSVAKSNSFNSTEYNPNVSQLTEDGQDDMATMAVASWEVTVEEMLAFKGRGLQIKKHFPAPYSSGVTLVLESQCNLHQEV